ncbi:MAG: hypothetical protein JKY56_13910 [Kofleriaceae bacterium]|nr:hypothetical protein [Kofleriaceae bacterium]
MSDEKQPSDAPPKTRRRRRRKPVGAAPENKSESQESAGQSSGGQADGGPSQAGPGRQRNRKRRSRKRENANSSQGSSDSQTGEKAEQSSRSSNNSQSRRPARSRRNAQSPRSSQSRRDSEEKSNEGLGRNHNRSTQSAQNDAPAAGDDSFRDNPPIAEPVRAPQVAGPNWGDDSDAPTPDIELKADLPPDSARRDLDPTSTYLLDQEEGEDFQGALSARICNVISVRFAVAGRLYLYDAGDGIYNRGDKVLVESDRGERIAIVAVPSQRRPPPRSLKKILGRAKIPSPEEQEAHEARDRDFLKTAIAEAKKLTLSIKIFRATLEDGGRKLAISYSCESKTDVRRLSRALSNQYSHRVDLRHFGARDEAKLVGGIGSCGQELCCTTWLPAFVPVSIKKR